MARQYRIISADSHVNPPPTMYEEYLPARFRDRAPRVERRGGGDVQVFEGKEERFSLTSAVAGWRPEEYRRVGTSFQEGRRGGWDPQARIEDMDVDGVDAEVLFGAPHGGGTTLATADRQLQFGLMQAYNDWLADFCRGYPDRLFGIGEIPHWDQELAIAEAGRIRRNGLRGVLIPAIPTLGGPSPSRPYTDPWYDPLWSALEDLAMPVHLHLGVKPLTPGLEASAEYGIIRIACTKPMAAEPIGSLIFSGALERHPRLRVVSVESGVGWMAHLVPWMDYTFQRHRYVSQSPLKELPSAYFHRQVRATFIDDPVGVRERHTIGLQCIMWSSDYPHSQSTWPHSGESIRRHFEGIPEAERQEIVCGNAIRLYAL